MKGAQGVSAPLVKVIGTFEGAQPPFIKHLLSVTMLLREEDRGKVRSYQKKENAQTLCWLSPSFNTFRYTAVVNKILPEFLKWVRLRAWSLYFQQCSPSSYETCITWIFTSDWSWCHFLQVIACQSIYDNAKTEVAANV